MKTVRLLLLVVLLASTLTTGTNKDKYLTIAEKSNFESTSRHEDVMNFFKSLKKISPNFRIESM